jgi:AcrR family transcriptional regulator
MSLYTHVRNKDDLLDGMVDLIVGEIPLTTDGGDWKSEMRRTVLAARQAILQHRWAPRVIEERTAPGPATTAYFDALTGILRRGGLSIDLTHHALHLMGSRALGFSQDLFDDSSEFDPEVAAAMAEQLRDTHPYIAEMVVAVSHEGGLGGCDDDVEFAFALDVILDGLERLRVRTKQDRSR